MIQVRIQTKEKPAITPDNVLYFLDAQLAKEEFYGTILLTYECGQLKAVKAQQNFTVDSLVDHLSK